MSDYPEHDKLVAVKNQSQVIGEFIEWLQEDNWRVERRECEPFRLEVKLAEFFEIDLTKIEAEKRQMLAAFRALSTATNERMET